MMANQEINPLANVMKNGVCIWEKQGLLGKVVFNDL